MKNIALIVLTFISLNVVGQRKLVAGTTTRHPITENQITKKDSIDDEFGLEYYEREFQGEEEDTAFLNNDFRQREALKKGKITDPEREIIEFDYDKIFYSDMRDPKEEDVEKTPKVKAKKEEPIKKK
jgi:hypothetical protein